MAQYPIPPHKTKTSNHKAWRGIGWREKGLPMSLKSFTLLDELSLEGSLCKSVQGECCAASLLAGIIFEETSSIRHCVPTKEKISHIWKRPSLRNPEGLYDTCQFIDLVELSSKCRSNPFPLTRLPRRYAPRNDEVPAQIASALHNSPKGSGASKAHGALHPWNLESPIP